MSRSHDLFQQAQQHIPGGVNSPVRAFRGVGGDPVFIDRAAGAYLFDADGRRYLDYVGSWGPMLLGHAHPEVIQAVHAAVDRGLSFGAPTESETRMADLVCELVPSLELVRMVSSGTEATMSAIRLARGYTGRDKIVKFEGCYHGHSDSLLVKAGSGALTLGEPSSPGVPAALAELTITLNYNDLEQVERTFAAVGGEIACIIVEPVAGNMNCIPPQPGFLEGLRRVCDQYGTLLIFDEVMTGFRVALGGAQGLYGVRPDLTTLGKVIGGGMPVGAFGGRREVMERIAPLGPVYQAGTLSGNPVAMAAGLKTLELISAPGFYQDLGARTERLVDGLLAAAAAAGIPLSANRVGGMFGIFFTDAGPVSDFTGATACDQERFRGFFHAMLERGVYLAPSAFEAGFVSAAHSEADIDASLEAAAGAFAALTAWAGYGAVGALFDQLLAWVALHPIWAGLIVFLVAMAESLAIVGVVVPGVAMMFGVGALISAGALHFWPTLTWAVAGAVLGDALSFFLGRHYQHQLRSFWPFSRHPDMLDQGVRFFQRYGGKSVVFGRFVGPVRAVVPLVAGMLGMSPARFLAANIGSALAWAPAYLLPGMVFGASLELASEVAFRLVVLLVILIALLWFVAWLVKRVFRLIHPRAGALVGRLLLWSQLHPKLGEIGNALANPDHREGRGLALFASLLLTATVLFALVLTAVLGGGEGQSLDQTLWEALQSLRTPWADHLMVSFSRLADLGPVLGLGAAVGGLLAWRRDWSSAGHWLAALAFGLLAAPLVKHLVQIPRPDSGVAGLGPYAFPSAHVLRATVIYGFLAVLIARAVNARWRWLPYALAGLATACVAVARLYLGVHWLSDALGALTLGLIWISALGIAHRRHSQLQTGWPALTATSVAALCLGLGLQSVLYHKQQVAAYTPQRSQTEMALADWWQGGWQQLPRLRADTLDRGDHPINLQYAGAPTTLQHALEPAGWRRAQMLGWDNLLRLLSPSLPLQELPVPPQVHDGRHESLALEKPLADGGRLVLRLWPADIRLQPDGQPLWLGNVSTQSQQRLLGLFNFPRTLGEFDAARNELINDSQGLKQRLPEPADREGPLLVDGTKAHASGRRF